MMAMADFEERLQLVKYYDSAPDSALFTATEVAALVGISESTLARVRCGYKDVKVRIPSIAFGKKSIRYKKADIQRYIDSLPVSA
jgi:predicted DNA-binding transcriptional regulator AlpA